MRMTSPDLHQKTSMADTQLGQDTFGGHRERPRQGASTGADVAATTKTFGNLGDIHHTLTAQTGPPALPVGEFAKKDRYFDTGHPQRPIRQAFAVLVNGAAAFLYRRA